MISIKSRPLIIGMSCLLALAACEQTGKPTAASAPAGAIAVTVNGTPISQAAIDYVAKERIAQGQPDTPELRKAMKDHLVTSELIAQEATKKGLDKNPEIATQLSLLRLQVLTKAFVMDYLKSNPVSDDALKAEYDKIKAQMGDKEYKARHILVKTEDEAKNIIAGLKKGEKFEKLAEKSEDPGSKSRGGDLGWFPAGQMVKPFSDALAKLEKGKYTAEPVQTQFGWHVILLEDSRPAQAPAFEQVKEPLAQQLQQKQLEKIVADLKAKAKIDDPTAAPAPAKKEGEKEKK
ncbi:MAG: peptidylprolyl isomerase [Pseudomonadota bacterium]|jgi:peptidyl-prolyl cis-trans isomerase C